jgi:hypothetical protein
LVGGRATPLVPRAGTTPRETAVSPSKRRGPASFPATRPDSVACAPKRMPSLRDRCPIVHRGSREPLSPHDAASLVSASFHRFTPLLPRIGSFRAYRRRAIAAIDGLTLSSIPPIHARGTRWTEPVPPSSVQPIFQACAELKQRRAGAGSATRKPLRQGCSLNTTRTESALVEKRIHNVGRSQAGGSAAAMTRRIRSGSEATPVLFITAARWFSTVRWLMPRS